MTLGDRGTTIINLGFIVGALAIGSASVASAQGFGQASGGVAWTLIRGNIYATTVGAGGESSSTGASLGGEFDVTFLPERSGTFPGGAFYSPAATIPQITVRVSNHFTIAGSDTRPFVSAGLAVYPGRESFELFEIGGGVDHWLDAHTGVRVEVRDQFLPTSAMPAFLIVRFGVLFR